jgi:hypothetical protein
MVRATSGQKHLIAVNSGQIPNESSYPNESQLLKIILQRLRTCKPVGKAIAYRAVYPFGTSVLVDIGGGSTLVAPCQRTTGVCPECQHLLDACDDGNPLVIVVKNSVEIYQNTSKLAQASGQSPTVPLEICGPGKSLGLSSALADILPQSSASLLRPIQEVAATAGARSIFVGTPLADQELALKLLSSPRVLALDDQEHENIGAFNYDPWSFIRLLASAAESSVRFQGRWNVEALVVPRAILRRILAEGHEAKSTILKLALDESNMRGMP